MRDDELKTERDLYRTILELAAAEEEVEPFLKKVLELVMTRSRARRCFVGLGAPDAEKGVPAAWWTIHAPDGEEAGLEMRVSSTIIRAALDEGETVRTFSALLDERFSQAASVRRTSIESALCVPVGRREGVIYLEGQSGDRDFITRCEDSVRLLAQVMAGVAWKLLHPRGEGAEDPTAPYRARMKLETFVGRSSALRDLFDRVERFAEVESPILLKGPSGVGKSRIARALHDHSKRAGRPFMAINCAGLSEDLAWSELFGHVKGAFTGAAADKRGLVAACDGGTLFLDEIAETSPQVQARLLTFLDDQTFRRLGDTTQRRADVRIVAATNVDLDAAVSAGTLRRDLRFRFKLEIPVPALSDRREDIPLLMNHFAQAMAERHGWTLRGFTTHAIEAAKQAPWPGNVRELENRVEQAVITSRGYGGLITSGMLELVAPLLARTVEVRDLYPLSLKEARRQFDLQHIEKVLERMNGNVSKTVGHLDISRGYFYKIRKSHELQSETLP
ncbi:MAG: sigma-54 dependent transcriptional regulator [Myxococcota bacterium]